MSPPPRPAGEAIDRREWNGLSKEFKTRRLLFCCDLGRVEAEKRFWYEMEDKAE